MKYIFFLILNFTLFTSYGQDNNLIRDMEMAEKAERDRELERIYQETSAGNYKIADQLYIAILATGKAIPSNFCFHFGKNSYHLDKYAQSIDWLTKYIALKGTSGNYYESAKELLEESKIKLREKRKVDIVKTEALLSQNFDIDCGPSGKVICPVCEGETVIVKKNAFGQNSYQTCSYCDKNGYMSCEKYNKLLKGELTNN